MMWTTHIHAHQISTFVQGQSKFEFASLSFTSPCLYRPCTWLRNTLSCQSDYEILQTLAFATIILLSSLGKWLPTVGLSNNWLMQFFLSQAEHASASHVVDFLSMFLLTMLWVVCPRNSLAMLGQWIQGRLAEVRFCSSISKNKS